MYLLLNADPEHPHKSVPFARETRDMCSHTRGKPAGFSPSRFRAAVYTVRPCRPTEPNMFQRAHDYMYVQHTTLLCSHKTLISSLQANRITAWPVSGNNLLLSYAANEIDRRQDDT